VPCVLDLDGLINCLVTNILQNIFLCVQQKKEIHTGLKQLDGNDDIIFILKSTISLSKVLTTT